jgi:hypothetical protein
MGRNGIALIGGSGTQGYWEVDSGTRKNLGLIGLATDDWHGLDFSFYSNSWKGILWHRDGRVSPKVCSTKPMSYTFNSLLSFENARVLGLMVCCSATPKIHFYMDGIQVHSLNLPMELYGMTLFPCGPQRCEGICTPLTLPSIRDL